MNTQRIKTKPQTIKMKITQKAEKCVFKTII